MRAVKDNKKMKVVLTDFCEELVSLRHKTLHPDGPVSRVLYDADKRVSTKHFSIFDNVKVLIACGTLIMEDDDQKLSLDKNRIRGMAVDSNYRGQGIGKLILEEMLKETNTQGIKYTWCNARLSVLPFYEKKGFVKVGETFDVPGSGPHYKMIRDLR